MRNTLYPLVWVGGVILVQRLPELPTAAWRLAIVGLILILCLTALALGWASVRSGLADATREPPGTTISSGPSFDKCTNACLLKFECS